MSPHIVNIIISAYIIYKTFSENIHLLILKKKHFSVIENVVNKIFRYVTKHVIIIVVCDVVCDEKLR